jgi:hypothetical protein
MEEASKFVGPFLFFAVLMRVASVLGKASGLKA